MRSRTDLALEEKELWEKSAAENTALRGVKARTEERAGIVLTEVDILNDEGARALQKPVGRYLTLELKPVSRHEPDGFRLAAEEVGRQAAMLLRGAENVLVVGLGNPDVTPDALGPETLKSLIVTRHLKRQAGHIFDAFRTVSAVQPGVLGSTGLESLELVRGAVRCVRPDAVVVVDALAAVSLSRVCSTVQLSSTGIIPGSGVGNHRAAFNEQTLGVPVTSVGVPTVMDAETALSPETAGGEGIPAGMIVTPRDIDQKVREMGRVVGYGLDLALHRGLTVDSITCFLP